MHALIKGCLRARPVVEMHVNAHRLSLGDICYIEQVGHGIADARNPDTHHLDFGFGMWI